MTAKRVEGWGRKMNAFSESAGTPSRKASNPGLPRRGRGRQPRDIESALRFLDLLEGDETSHPVSAESFDVVLRRIEQTAQAAARIDELAHERRARRSELRRSAVDDWLRLGTRALVVAVAGFAVLFLLFNLDDTAVKGLLRAIVVRASSPYALGSIVATGGVTAYAKRRRRIKARGDRKIKTGQRTRGARTGSTRPGSGDRALS